MKLIVFLGAGISVPSGLPKVDRLTQMILRDPYHQDRDGNFISGRNPDSRSRQTYPTSVVRALLRCISRYDERGSKSAVYRGAPTYEDLFSLCGAITLWHQGLCTVVVISGYGWGDTAINWRFDTWLDQDRRNCIILLHRRPEEIAERSPIVGRAYDYWIRSRHLLPVPKWLCETSMRDIVGMFCPASREYAR